MFNTNFNPRIPHLAFIPFVNSDYLEELEKIKNTIKWTIESFDDLTILTRSKKSLVSEIIWHYYPEIPVLDPYSTWEQDPNLRSFRGDLNQDQFPNYVKEFKSDFIHYDKIRTQFHTWKRRFRGDPTLFHIKAKSDDRDLLRQSYPHIWFENGYICFSIGDYWSPIQLPEGIISNTEMRSAVHQIDIQIREALSCIESNFLVPFENDIPAYVEQIVAKQKRIAEANLKTRQIPGEDFNIPIEIDLPTPNELMRTEEQFDFQLPLPDPNNDNASTLAHVQIFRVMTPTNSTIHRFLQPFPTYVLRAMGQTNNVLAGVTIQLDQRFPIYQTNSDMNEYWVILRAFIHWYQGIGIFANDNRLTPNSTIRTSKTSDVIAPVHLVQYHFNPQNILIRLSREDINQLLNHSEEQTVTRRRIAKFFLDLMHAFPHPLKIDRASIFASTFGTFQQFHSNFTANINDLPVTIEENTQVSINGTSGGGFEKGARELLKNASIEKVSIPNKTPSLPIGSPIPLQHFVNPDRIEELRKAKYTDFDLARLVRLCEEINICYAQQAYFGVLMLTRAIMDHIPPLFKGGNFDFLLNNYGGSKQRSFKDSMSKLDGARKIADSFLHSHIRVKEPLPNEQQVHFIAHLDHLLVEIISIAE